MDHTKFLATLPNDVKAALTSRSDKPGLAHLAGHFGAIVIVGCLILWRVPFWQFLLPIQGILIMFLFTLEHEATHKTPFRTEWINELVGRLCGVLIILPFTWFRFFHLAHHRYTNVPGKDPELLAGAKPENWPAFVWHVTGIPYWRSMIQMMLSNAFGKNVSDFVPAAAAARVRTEARWMLALYAALTVVVAAGASGLVWAWIIPLIIGQPFLRIYLLAEHGRCPFVANMFENTRTTFTNTIVRFFAWNMPYHIEHHTYPNVPYHKLPDLHILAAEHLVETERGYVRFASRYVAGFSAK
ncbi:MAG: fatty acid desaturase [Boseongicola sp.]